MTIETLLQRTQAESEIARASQKTVQSIELEIRSRDLLLGWVFNGEYSSVQDDRDQIAFARRTQYDNFTFDLVKPFSTGPTLLLQGVHDDATYTPSRLGNSEGWEVRLTQALWRDSFGHGTYLRYQGEKAELISRKAQAYYELQNFLVTVETLFWDLSLAAKEQEIRNRNIENGKLLEKWTRRRAANSAAEKSDLLQSQALVSQATLDSINAQNQIETYKNQLRQYIPDMNLADIVADERSIEQDRSIDALIVKDGSGEPRRLDTISAEYLAQQAAAEAKKVKDSFRPRVDAFIAYGQNGIAGNAGDAWERATDPDHSISRVGVVLSVDLSRGLVADRVRAAELESEAAILRAKSQNRASAIGWEDLRRQISLLKARAQEAAKLSDLQIRKVKEERQRFRLGRSTVFQLVTYELDAANSELNKYRAMADLRKAESQARLFTTLAQGDS